MRPGPFSANTTEMAASDWNTSLMDLARLRGPAQILPACMLMQFTKKNIRPLDEKLNAFGPEAPVGFIVMRLGYMCSNAGSKKHHESGRSPVELLLADRWICRGWFLKRFRLEQNSSGSRPIGNSSLVFFCNAKKALRHSQWRFQNLL